MTYNMFHAEIGESINTFWLRKKNKNKKKKKKKKKKQKKKNSISTFWL